jgi:hypothetical protein
MARPLPLLLACPALLASLPVQAAGSPVPDRPFEAKSGYLVSSGSLELELGGLWADGGYHSPARLKYGLGKSFEPRLSADLSGAGNGSPDLAVEGKFRLHRASTWGLAGYVVSALPVADESWDGTARILFSAKLDHLLLGLNSGLDFAGQSGGLVIAGVPMVVLLGTPLGHSWSGFGEGSLVVDGSFRDIVVDAGLRWTTTDILTLDAAAGWRLEMDVPYVTVGLSANLGKLGG